MINKIIDLFKHLDHVTCKIMKHGLIFCSILSFLAICILVIYNFTFPSPFFYYIGIHLLKLSFIFGIEFIVCGLVVDSIKKELV